MAPVNSSAFAETSGAPRHAPALKLGKLVAQNEPSLPSPWPAATPLAALGAWKLLVRQARTCQLGAAQTWEMPPPPPPQLAPSFQTRSMPEGPSMVVPPTETT